ncbi:MAG TPA: hypothetical protein PK263_03755 [bacterium]|nr:hypothetical protein [bacterium]
MKLRIEDKSKAIVLRRQGCSYGEIRKIIPNLSKGTISGWLKNIELTKEQRVEISSRAVSAFEKNRIKGAWANKEKACNRIAQIQSDAESKFAEFAKKHLFIAGIMLYWAEGSKTSRSFQFMNSDPRLIRLMLKFLREVVQVDEHLIKIRLYIHKVYETENCENYWSDVTGIPINRFQKTVFKLSLHNTKKNPRYKGCCRIEITRSEIFWKIAKWEELLYCKLENKRP